MIILDHQHPFIIGIGSTLLWTKLDYLTIVSEPQNQLFSLLPSTRIREQPLTRERCGWCLGMLTWSEELENFVRSGRFWSLWIEVLGLPAGFGIVDLQLRGIFLSKRFQSDMLESQFVERLADKKSCSTVGCAWICLNINTKTSNL